MSLLKHYDLLIVGAGPAGATAAAHAARAGLNVALIEKQTLPRRKTCGGGVPMAVGHLLDDLAPADFIERRVDRMRHTWKFGDPFVGEINPPNASPHLSLWMVQRHLFDLALVRRAQSYSAHLFEGLTVRALERASSGVTVRAQTHDNGSAFVATADYLIGADGATGVVEKLSGLRMDRSLALAMEIEHPYDWSREHEVIKGDMVHLEYGVVPDGYAWIFPKGEHLNIGAGVFRVGKGVNGGVKDVLQQAICGYMDALGIPYHRDKLLFRAHPLPIWSGKRTVHTRDGRILLTGDSASLINPLFGDGILPAIKSGHIAAQSVIDGATLDYSSRIHNEFATNFDAALTLSRFFYQFPGMIYRYGVKRDSATRTAARLICGDALFTDVTKRAMRRVRRMMVRT